MNALLFVLAQTTQSVGAPAPGNETPPWWANPNFVLYAVIMIGILWVFSSTGRSGRQKEKQQRAMIDSLKRGDRVQTIGGILGSVVEVRDDEVVIKIDEGNNTKLHIVREAIKSVTREEAETVSKGKV